MKLEENRRHKVISEHEIVKQEKENKKMTGNGKILQMEHFWVTTRFRKAAC